VGVAERPLAGPAHNSTAIANCDCGFVCTFPASDEVGLSVLRSSSPQYPVPRPAQDSARVIGKRQAVRGSLVAGGSAGGAPHMFY